MTKTNKVFLEGGVAACKLRGDAKYTVGDILLYTVYPDKVDGESPSERLGKIFHRVRVVAPKGMDGELRELDDLVRGGPSGSPVCRQVRGALKVVDGRAFVQCDIRNFIKLDRLPVHNNNYTELSGRISEITYSDMGAVVNVDAGGGQVSAYASKDMNPALWELISSGRLGKGEAVSMSGPLLSSEYSDGKHTLRTAMLIMHKVQSRKLEERKGPVAGVKI